MLETQNHQNLLSDGNGRNCLLTREKAFAKINDLLITLNVINFRYNVGAFIVSLLNLWYNNNNFLLSFRGRKNSDGFLFAAHMYWICFKMKTTVLNTWNVWHESALTD